MNHRTGGLVAADFDDTQSVPAPAFHIDSDFGGHAAVVNLGGTFKAPAPQRRAPMFADSEPASAAVAAALVLGCVVIALILAGVWK